MTQIKESACRLMADAKTRMDGRDLLDFHDKCRLVTDLRAKSGTLVKTMPFSELLEQFELLTHEEIERFRDERLREQNYEDFIDTLFPWRQRTHLSPRDVQENGVLSIGMCFDV